MVRMIMHGCNGRMGQMITGIVDRDDEIRIVAGVDINDKQLNDYPVFKSINDVNVEADVVVDFGATAAIDNLLSWCKNTKTPCVVCTTGLSEEQIANVSKTAESVAMLRSANMSLGINTLIKLLKEAANVFAPAVESTVRKSGASAIMPFSTAQPGTNMYFRPSTAPSSVQARTMQISSITNRAGIPTEQTFSMPPPIPPRTISVLSCMNL